MINEFKRTCKERGESVAIICDGKGYSFSRLLSDVHRMISMFKSKNIERGEKVLLLVTPSYEFYALMLASIYYGINIVVMDSYKNLGRIAQTMSDNSISKVFCNSKTEILKIKFPKNVSFINVTKYGKYENAELSIDENPGAAVLTTFTSGTTGKPKPIERTTKDLATQIKVVEGSIDIDDTSVVYAGLPIYALFLIYSGKSCIISRRINRRELEKFGATAVVAPIAGLLKLKKALPTIKELYLGGAMLYYREAKSLSHLFPSANITYIYGSSECVLMAKADLNAYISNNFALQPVIDGVNISIIDKDDNGIGRICAEGEVVLTESKSFVGGDLGYIDSLGLHIVGRAAYSSGGYYNYLTDSRLLCDNPEVKKGFSFVNEGKLCFCYIGKISKKEDNIEYYKFHRLPMDPKHRTKLNYKKVIEQINRK